MLHYLHHLRSKKNLTFFFFNQLGLQTNRSQGTASTEKPPSTVVLLQLSRGNSSNRQNESVLQKQAEGAAELSPVQTADHISHCVDETLVFLWVTDDQAVELLHIGVNSVQSRCLSATCTATAQDKGS